MGWKAILTEQYLISVLIRVPIHDIMVTILAVRYDVNPTEYKVHRHDWYQYLYNSVFGLSLEYSRRDVGPPFVLCLVVVLTNKVDCSWVNDTSRGSKALGVSWMDLDCALFNRRAVVSRCRGGNSVLVKVNDDLNTFIGHWSRKQLYRNPQIFASL